MTKCTCQGRNTCALAKSGVRVLGYITLFFNVPVAAALLIISELLGVYAELSC